MRKSFLTPIFSSLNGIILFTIVLLITACSKIDKMELNKGDNPLSVSADKTNVVLEEINRNADALEISWTSGTNKGTNAAISYTVMIDKKGNNFAQAEVLEMGRAVFSKKYTVKDLNDLLISRWSVAPGESTVLEIKVLNEVQNHADLSDVSNVLEINVTTYKAVTTTLYLIGDAAPNGWSADNAEPLVPSLTDAGVFTYRGQLRAGEYKFITTLGSFLPSYNKGADDTKLLFRESDSDPDEKFVNASQGVYDITINLLTLSISVSAADLPPYERLWMLGDATPTGWNIDNPSEMRVDSSNLFVFTYNGLLNVGEFKIPVSTGDFGTDYYMPLTNAPDITETGVQWVAGGNPDYKWNITTAGPYKIKLDIQNLTINIKPFTPYANIWMVGDASPVGWNIDSPQPMTPTPGDPYEFSYTGPLNAGEFKFPVETGNWGRRFLYARNKWLRTRQYSNEICTFWQSGF
ncbi:MAG: SusF/SusE family outer membrane protein [Chitinophagaceae bacterium]|nr:SusF/SusE family outer membrane protein [Chitinophagaceae bacterium]